MSALMAVRGLLRTPAVWTPGDLGASLTAWYDASSTDAGYMTHGGSPDSASAWKDRSGNGRDATQATFGYQPKLITSQRLTFEGADDYMNLPSGVSFSTTSRCVAAVAKVNTGETGNQVLVGPDGNNGFAFFLRATSDRCGITKANVSFFAQGPTVTTNADHVFLGNLTSSTWRVSLDGTATTGSHSQTFGSGLTGFIGVEKIGAPSTSLQDYLNGSLAELVICSELSEANQQKLEGYLAHRWGLSGNLPSDHPYKSAAP